MNYETHGSLVVLVPNIKNKNDVKTRLNSLVNDMFPTYDDKPMSNCLSPDEWEYEIYPNSIQYMSDLYDYIHFEKLKQTDPEIFGNKF